MRLTYDSHACTKPEACMACVKACPRAVLMLAPSARPKTPGDRPPRYVIFAAYESLCYGCGRCVEACPRGALSLK